MKLTRALFLGFILLTSVFSFAQNNTTVPYWEMMEDPNANFYDIQQAFDAYWQGRTMERGKGWKAFKRWENFVEPRVFPSGDMSLLNGTWSAYQDMQSAGVNRNAAGDWHYIGNTDVPSSGGGAGRINVVAIHPTDPNTILAGSPAGGLWRSTNGGSSWICHTDQLPTLGVSAIAFDPQNGNTIFIGTGDMDGGSTRGVGILKSTDGGITWNTTGLSFATGQDISVSRILIDPTNSNIMLAASNDGIYRSADAGNTWTQVSNNSMRDMEFKPDDPNIVYASRSARFYRSIDNGLTWTQITSGLSGSTMARIAIAVSPANPNYVYLLIGDTQGGFFGLYRSTDAGLNFTLRTNSPNLMGWEVNGSDSGGQANYDLAIAVDRNNAEIVYTGGVNIWRSTNGGSSFSIAAHWYGGGGNPYVHADIHDLVYSHHNNQLFAGCDGGVFRKSTSSSSWTDISNNLMIAQIYRLGGSATNASLIISGWQDNGTNLSGTPWEQVLGGDGMEAIINYSNANIMYGEYYYGYIERSTDGGNNWTTIAGSGGTNEDEDGAWVTPYIMHPTNPSILLMGKTQVYKTTNQGNSWSQLGSVGSGSSLINAMAFAPSNANYIYVSKSNKLYVSSDGNTFTDRSAGLPTNASITYIAVSNANPEHVWITYSGYTANKVWYSSNAGLTWSNYSTGIPNIPVNCIVYQNNSNDALYIGTDLGVFYRDNTSGTWTAFSNGLPNTIVDELEIHYGTGMLRAATYGRGIWESALHSYVPNDIRISEVLYPSNEVCGSAFAPEIRLFNQGDNIITSAQISYQLDNGPITNVSWNGSLQAYEDELITLPALAASAGAHVFRIWTSQPNNGNDDNLNNDTLQINITSDPNKVHTTLDLHTDCFGAETGWNIKSGATTLYSETAGTYPGTTALWQEGGLQTSAHFCLTPACYTLTMTDTESNGLNGEEDGCEINGSYNLNDESGAQLAQNATPEANFGASVTHNFCVSASYFASFSAYPTEICAGDTVRFSDLSSPGSTSWNWTFTGPVTMTSTQQNPIIVFPQGGTYQVSLTAGNGSITDNMTISGMVVVNASPQVSLSIADLNCYEQCVGKIIPIVSGGTTPYAFEWSNGATADSLTNLCAGNYGLQIRDAKGCKFTDTISIAQPSELLVNLSKTDATCGNQDGAVTSNVSGGTGSYAYLWSDSSAVTNLSNLDIGTYTLSVTDDNGCITTQSVQIIQPNAPNISITGNNETCNGDCNGTLSALVSGGTGALTLNWNNSLGNDTAYSALCPGNYILTVTDANGCTNRDTITIQQGRDYPVANFIMSDTTVNVGQTVSFVNMSTTSATNFFWDFGDGAQSFFSSSSHAYGSAGTYTVTNILNNGGCRDTLTATVFVVNGVGIEETLNDLIRLYPNPANEEVILDFGGLNVRGTLEIFDNKGNLIRTVEIYHSSLIHVSTAGLAEGIYHFSVRQDDYRLTRKLMIRH
jgi:PKD repeat protein/photosystem II stability/assembly factor-like uncharacterized protein